MLNKASYHTSAHLGKTLNPWVVTGLTDAEGCFNVSITKKQAENLIPKF
jgi:hypothetical protein